MAHRVVDTETIKNLEQDLENVNRAIAMAKDFSTGGKEALKQAVDIIRLRANGSVHAKDEALENGEYEKATLHYGEEKAYKFILAIFSDPKARINDLIRRRKEIQLQLDEYKKMEKR